MDMERLREYLEVASCLNFTRAAAHLNIAQSALSKHMALLEKEYGVKFFKREGSTVDLTRHGRAFCEEAQSMLDRYERSKRRMRSISESVRAGGLFSDPSLFECYAAAVKATKTPGLDATVLLDREMQGSFEEQLRSGKIDVYSDIALADDEVPSDFETSILARSPLCAVLNESHPLAKRERLSLGDVVDETLFRPSGSFALDKGARAIDEVLDRHGVRLRKDFFYAQSPFDFHGVDIVNQIFIMPQPLAGSQAFSNRRDVVIIPFADEDAFVSFRVVWRKNETRQVVLDFVHNLLEEGKRG